MPRSFGDGTTDYEKYIKTQAIYALMKGDEECANDDEPLFQATHQAMELWLAVTIQHLQVAERDIDADNLRNASRFLRRGAAIVDMLITSLRHLEEMPPWAYHAIRVTLGKGSGQQSPTFTQLLVQPRGVLRAYEALLKRRNTTVDAIQQDPCGTRELYDLTAAMLTFDENFMRWRFAHFQLVKRIIGDKVLSLKGVPASALAQTVHDAAFPDLWACISRTTNAYNAVHGAPGDSGAYKIMD